MEIASITRRATNAATLWSRPAPYAGLQPQPAEEPGVPGVRIGTLVSASAEAGVRVAYPGQPDDEPLAARSTVPLAPDHEGRAVLLVFEHADPRLPIVTGLLQDAPVAASVTARALPRTVVADGREVVIEAERELVLRCGKSSITLRADGEVLIRGVKIVSRARALNKVKGATVQIN